MNRSEAVGILTGIFSNCPNEVLAKRILDKYNSKPHELRDDIAEIIIKNPEVYTALQVIAGPQEKKKNPKREERERAKQFSRQRYRN